MLHKKLRILNGELHLLCSDTFQFSQPRDRQILDFEKQISSNLSLLLQSVKLSHIFLLTDGWRIKKNTGNY